MTFLKMTILNVKSVIVRFSLFQTEDKLCEYALICMKIIFFFISTLKHKSHVLVPNMNYA